MTSLVNEQGKRIILPSIVSKEYLTKNAIQEHGGQFIGDRWSYIVLQFPISPVLIIKELEKQRREWIRIRPDAIPDIDKAIIKIKQQKKIFIQFKIERE